MFRAVLRNIGVALLAVSAPATGPDSRPPAPAVPPGSRLPPGTIAGPGSVSGAGSVSAIGRGPAQQLRRELPDGSGVLLAGSLKLLGMTQIRQELGPAWTAVADRAYGLAESVIRQHLTTDDLCERHDDETYVLCFARLDKAAADRKTAEMTAEIKAALLREVPETAAVRFQNFVAEVNYDRVNRSAESILGSLLSSLEEVRREAEDAFQERRAALLREARLVYSPVMQVKHEVAVMNRCLVSDAAGRIALEQLQAVSGPEEFLTALADLDFLILQRTIKALHEVIQASRKSYFLMPVNFQTLNQKKFRDDYFQLCSTVPEPYQKFMAIEIRSVPDGVPTSRILDVVLQVRRYCQYVVLNVHAHETRLGEVIGGGLFGISMELGELGEDPRHAMQVLTRVIAAARAANLTVIAHGANTLGLAKAAIAAGADYLDGEAVAPRSSLPKAAHKLKTMAV